MSIYILPIFAVLIGFLFVLIFKPSKKKNLKLLLAFSGAFLLSITVFEMLPQVFSDNGGKVGLFIMLGILLQIFLEFFSKGAEHGHVHIHQHEMSFPWLLFISLSIHALLEGFPIKTHDNLVLGIVIHKIPVAVILTTFFFNSNIKRWQTIIFLVLFAFMTPLGSYLNTLEAINDYQNLISALVIGIFLHISTTILFESTEGHKFNLAKMTVIVTAIIIAYFL
ncbi:ZIP family metal transporter [Sungkyunkwania multivorans]|uniref:ZIP family metal transporter n=1 Tax=Sungkyunkwania multivorans TaxID=1173618 RepID=A0ABW3CT83_9FLAO